MSDLKNEARDALENAKEKAGNVFESLKDKAAGAVESVKRGRSRTAAGDVKNELFDGLEAQALQQQRSAQQEAEDMQRRLEALMRGEPAGAPDAEEPDADETRED